MGRFEDGHIEQLGYNPNAFAYVPPHLALLGRIVKLLAAPIGLASEALHQGRKGSDSEPSTEETATEDPVYIAVTDEEANELIVTGQAVNADGHEPTHELVNEDADDVDLDEADWTLDDIAEDVELPHRADMASPTPCETISWQTIASPVVGSTNKLPYPVILPQRRPGTKTRGFIRAYAPVLQDRGITQETFMAFLKDFHTAAQASPVLKVLTVVTGLAAFSPDPYVGLPLQALQMAFSAAQEIQERWRMNKFLNQANREFFIPRGLLALVVAYKLGEVGKAEVTMTTKDIGAVAMAKYGDEVLQHDQEDAQAQGMMGSTKEKMKRLRVASAKTRANEIPVVSAPLIFPALEDAHKRREWSLLDNVKEKSKTSAKFVGNYFDRRAQAEYAASNPSSKLAAQSVKPEFKSRYADPNNITNKHFFSLITGGRWKAQPLGAKRRWDRAQRKAEQRRLNGDAEKPRKRTLAEDVLYLMVVDVPTDTDIELARKRAEEAKAAKAAKS